LIPNLANRGLPNISVVWTEPSAPPKFLLLSGLQGTISLAKWVHLEIVAALPEKYYFISQGMLKVQSKLKQRPLIRAIGTGGAGPVFCKYDYELLLTWQQIYEKWHFAPPHFSTL